MRVSPWSRAIAAALAILAGAGCRAAEDSAALRRDSAGIEIVESPSPRWRRGSEWTVDPSPSVSIGGALDGEPARQFTHISGALRLADGVLVVVDRPSAELRFFDSTGAHLRTAGGRGGGPGELGSFDRLVRTPGDSLVVASLMPPRELVFDGDGRFVRAHATPIVPGGRRPSATQAVLADGTRLVMEGGFSILAPSPRGRTDSVSLFAAGPGSDTARLVGRFPSIRISAHPAHPAAVAYAPTFEMAAWGDDVLIGYPESFEIRAHAADGRLRRIIRRAWTPVPVDQRARDLHLEHFLRPDAPPSLRAIGEATTFAEAHPAYDELLVDPDGTVWARIITAELAAEGRSATERVRRGFRWSLFDSTGAWLGDLDTPPGLEVKDIGREHIVGVWRDADDVPHVRVHRLLKH